MEMTGNVLVLFCVGLAVVSGVQSLNCTSIPAYNYLNDFLHHDKCESVDTVFKHLQDLTGNETIGNCRRYIINTLANHYGAQAHTPDHCQCSGTFKLQNYGHSSNVTQRCLHHNSYADMYRHFFTSDNQPHNLYCHTHHSLWTQIRGIHDHECQRDIVYHISYAFSQHGDPCSCSEKPVTTSSPNNFGQGQQDHCYQYGSYRELKSLLDHSKCMSANTVWHLLDDLQKHDSVCRTHIQNLLSHSYSNVPADGNNECVCTPKHTLTNKQHLHPLTNNQYEHNIYIDCRDHEPGSTYSAIERDLFTHITDHGCRNHNYLWPTLADVKNHTSNWGIRDCTRDLITRAAMDYPYENSDICSCVQETATSSTLRTTTTTTTTSTTHQTTTPATTTKHSDVTTTSHENHVTTTHSPVQHGQGHDHCDQFNSYKELASLANHSKCLSANTVWHLLDNLQKHDSGCRIQIQNLLLHSYNNVPTDGNDECVCTPKHTLTNKQHLQHTNNDHTYSGCRDHEPGSTYSAIERDLFTNITGRGCRNHNYLWPTLAGVKNHTGYSSGFHDCTQDLITRATKDYPSEGSDNCVCVQKTITPSTLTTTTSTSTTQQTATPTTTKSDVTTTSHGSVVVTQTTISSHNENGWESWSPWTCKIMKSDLLATCHNYRQRHCLSNTATDCEESSFETMDCHESQCSDADITHVNCSVYNQYSTCEDQISCTYFSKTPWKICGDAARVAQCPRLCTCCPITTTSPTTKATQTTTPTTTTTTTTTSSTTMTQSHPTTSSSNSYAECNFDCGYHGRCYDDGCHCFPGYLGDRCEQAITASPTTTSTQTTTTTPEPEAVMTNLASTSTTMTKETPTASSTTTLTPVQATATTPRTTETITTQQTTEPITSTTTQQPSTTTPLRQCNHTCTLDAVILSMAVKNSEADSCSDKRSASNEALPMNCCNMGDHHNWTKGAQVQTNRMCTDGTPPPYTPIAAFNETGFLIPDTAGIFYGCIKDRQSGFMMIHQTCELLPHLLHVDGKQGIDPNTYFMFH